MLLFLRSIFFSEILSFYLLIVWEFEITYVHYFTPIFNFYLHLHSSCYREVCCPILKLKNNNLRSFGRGLSFHPLQVYELERSKFHSLIRNNHQRLKFNIKYWMFYWWLANKSIRGAHGVMVIVVGNGHGDTFKSWTRLIAFHIALIPLGKVWIQLFSLQLWVNCRTDWVLQP